MNTEIAPPPAPLLQALARTPADAETLAQIGLHYFQATQWPVAAAYFEAANCLSPSSTLDLLRGHTANHRGEQAHARACFERVLTHDAGHIEARAGLGNSYFLEGRWADAVPLYESLAEQLPQQADIPACLGKCYRMLLRLPESIALYRRALMLDPSPANYSDLAWVFFELGGNAQAEATYRQALHAHPDNADLRYGYGFFLLHTGRWEEGWPLYEERWNTTKLGPRYHHIIDNLSRPMWDGKASLEGKTVMVLSEQGAGDLIQFVRYARELAARGATVDILAPPFMESIMKTVPWARAVHTRYEHIPPYDYYVPLMSCPLFFGLRPGAIPRADAPYIHPPHAVERFCDKPTIGLVWAGDPNNDYEFYRSPGFAAYEPLIDAHPEYRFVSLQVGPALAQAQAYIDAGTLIPASAGFKDFGDTAAAMASLDLVITSCTSPLHLAGAMGVPTMGLLSASPDWRWLGEEGATAWYPSVTLYRQKTLGEWGEVIARVSQGLPQTLKRK